MRILITLTLFFLSLFAQEFSLKHWEKGETFGAYLNKYGIDASSFYQSIDPEDLKFISFIPQGTLYFENVKNGELKELIIPLGEKMQIYVKEEKNGDYSFDIVPMKYKTIQDSVSLKIKNGCYSDLSQKINNPHLATYLKKIFSEYVDFVKLQKGDIVTIKYKQKSFHGIPFGEPEILAGYIKNRNSEFFAIKKKDGYKIVSNAKLKETISKNTTKVKKVVQNRYMQFKKPLPHLRVTSKFTFKRWHPILHKYRPHLGTDFGARKGTPIYAIASGKVIYAGWMGGYGKTVKILHPNGFVSLYGHQSKLYVRAGQRVKAGQKIGAVGNTGRSTGPHLHLSLYRYGKHKNPMKYINKKIKVGSTFQKIVINSKKTSSALTYKEKIVYNTLKKLSAKNMHPYKWKTLDKPINITIKKEKNHANRVKLSSLKGASRELN